MNTAIEELVESTVEFEIRPSDSAIAFVREELGIVDFEPDATQMKTYIRAAKDAEEVDVIEECPCPGQGIECPG